MKCRCKKEKEQKPQKLHGRAKRKALEEAKLEEARTIEKTKAAKKNSDPLDIFY